MRVAAVETVVSADSAAAAAAAVIAADAAVSAPAADAAEAAMVVDAAAIAPSATTRAASATLTASSATLTASAALARMAAMSASEAPDVGDRACAPDSTASAAALLARSASSTACLTFCLRPSISAAKPSASCLVVRRSDLSATATTLRSTFSAVNSRVNFQSCAISSLKACLSFTTSNLRELRVSSRSFFVVAVDLRRRIGMLGDRLAT